MTLRLPRLVLLTAALLLLFPARGWSQDARTFLVTNLLDDPWPDAPASLPLPDGDGSWRIVRLPEGREIPSQSDDLDGDGRADVVFTLVSLAPREAVRLRIEPGACRLGDGRSGVARGDCAEFLGYFFQ